MNSNDESMANAPFRSEVEGIEITQSAGILRVRLARPAKRNALNKAMLTYLEDLLVGLKGDVRVVVLSSEGSVFCSGLDLNDRQSAEKVPRGTSPIEPVLDAIGSCGVPVVAAVQGDAIAGGCELALSCDLVVAARTATFSMPLARVGLSTTWCLTTRLLEVVGFSLTRELLLGGHHIRAERLFFSGAIADAVEADQVGPRAEEIAREITSSAPLSVVAMKAMIQRAGSVREGVSHHDVEAMADAARASRDAREGISARLEHRTPRFEGI